MLLFIPIIFEALLGILTLALGVYCWIAIRRIRLNDPHLRAVQRYGTVVSDLRDGQPTHALELLATKAGPRAHNDDVYHWLRARALGALRRHAEALEACDQALRINVRIYPAYIQRAESLYELARYDEALQNLGYALHPSRQQAEVYALRAKIYAAMGQPEASEAEAQQAAELAGVNR